MDNTNLKTGFLDEPIRKNSLWVLCPKCKNRTKIKIFEDTVLLKFPLYCQNCKKEYTVGIINLKMHVSNEPDA